MFTHERVVFALCFLAAFIILLIWSYKTDKEERRDNFKGSTKVIITVIVLLLLLTSLTRVLRFF